MKISHSVSRRVFVGGAAALLVISAILLTIWIRQSETRGEDSPTASFAEVASIEEDVPADAPQLANLAPTDPKPADTSSNAVKAPTVPSPPVPSLRTVDPEVAQREVLATRRMVAAHAPLRDPRIADPDSVENQRILQTMVLKALKRPDFVEETPVSTSIQP